MSKEKDADLNTLVEGMKEVRALVDSKLADSGEAKEKMVKLEKDLGDVHEKQQKAEEERIAKEKAVQAEVDLLKEDYKTLHKLSVRKGYGNSDDDEKVLYAKYSGELDQYLRKGVNPASETLDEIAQDIVAKNMATKDEAEVARHKSLVTGINPDGGYLVFPDRRTDMQVTRVFETSPVRSVSKTITTTSDVVEVLINDNEFSSGGWVGEIAPRSDTDNAQFGQLSIHTHEQFAQPKVSQKMLDDSSINVEQLITDEVSKILTRTENTAFVSGDGSQKPRGFLDFPAWAVADTYERGKVEQVNSGVLGAIKADGIISLTNALKQEYEANAVFMMKRVTWGDVLKLKDGVGNYLLNIEMLPEGAGLMLMGKRVWFANDMPVIANNSLSIIYGDFGVGYTIVDRIGIRVLRDPFTDRPFIVFYTTKRVGGTVTNYEALKIQKLAV